MRDGPAEQVIPSGLAKARAIALETVFARSLAVMLRRTAQSRFQSCFQAWEIIKWAKTPADFRYRAPTLTNPVPFSYIDTPDTCDKDKTYEIRVTVKEFLTPLQEIGGVKPRAYLSIKIEELMQLHSTEIVPADSESTKLGKTTFVPFYFDFSKLNIDPLKAKLRIELYHYVHPDAGNDHLFAGTIVRKLFFFELTQNLNFDQENFLSIGSLETSVKLYNKDHVATLGMRATKIGSLSNSFGSLYSAPGFPNSRSPASSPTPQVPGFSLRSNSPNDSSPGFSNRGSPPVYMDTSYNYTSNSNQLSDSDILKNLKKDN